MRRIGMALVPLAALFLFPCAAPAAEWLEPGAVELRTSFDLSYDDLQADGTDVGNVTDFDAALFTGYFLTGLVELGVGIFTNYYAFDPPEGGSSDRSSVGVIGGLLLNFETGRAVVPFVGAGAGWVDYGGDWSVNDPATTWILPRAEGGLRWLITDYATMNFSLVYAHWRNVEGVENATRDRFRFGIGISVFP